jgi:hypothetical protein
VLFVIKVLLVFTGIRRSISGFFYILDITMNETIQDSKYVSLLSRLASAQEEVITLNRNTKEVEYTVQPHDIRTTKAKTMALLNQILINNGIDFITIKYLKMLPFGHKIKILIDEDHSKALPDVLHAKNITAAKTHSHGKYNGSKYTYRIKFDPIWASDKCVKLIRDLLDYDDIKEESFRFHRLWDARSGINTNTWTIFTSTPSSLRSKLGNSSHEKLFQWWTVDNTSKPYLNAAQKKPPNNTNRSTSSSHSVKKPGKATQKEAASQTVRKWMPKANLPTLTSTTITVVPVPTSNITS